MLPANIHRNLFLFGLVSLAFGMMVGTVPTSIPQIILLGNWLLEMDFAKKWQRIRTNKLFWVLAAVYFIHLLGLTYTNDLQAGLNDLRTKVPLLLLPLVFFSSNAVSLKEFRAILLFFLGGCFANTAWCVIYSFVLHQNETGRDASRFMSHIRLGLYLNMAIACCVYFAAIAEGFYKKALMVLGAVYFVVMMYVLGLASGLVNFFILSFIGVCVIFYKQQPFLKVTSFLLLAIVTGFMVNYIRGIAESQLRVNDTENNVQLRESPSHRPYSHFDTIGQKENGNYVLINIQLDELKKEWALQFPADTFNFNQNAHNIKRYEVLVRYLASRGFNKDSVGISKLSDRDKKNISEGVCNYLYNDWSFLHKRVYELVCEYDDYVNSRDVNGHSLTMRLYFWHAALKIIKEHPVFGVGTGDVQPELNRVYEGDNFPLAKEWYKRPHNQFLTIVVALGLPGIVLFISSIIYPLILLRKKLPVLYWPFLILSLVSFMLEDTLETQAGLSFYAVFNTLFLSFAYYKKQSEPV